MTVPDGRRSEPSHDVAVVVPTYRRPDRLRRLLTALEAQTLPLDRFEVIVVDDASGDDTPAVLAAAVIDSPLVLRVITAPVNAGPAASRNRGWRATDAPLLAFVDDDVVPEPGWLVAGCDALAADAGLGVVQGRITTPPGTPPVALLPRWSVWREVEAPNPHFDSCSIFYRREAVAAAGGFDETHDWWAEDTALAWKVLDAGWGRAFAAAAVAAHDIEQRPVAWFARQAFSNRNVVNVAARFPAFRAEAFWRPWAFRRRDASLVAAVAGIAVALAGRAPLALLAALPYAWEARPPLRTGGRARTFAQTALVDAASVTGCLRGSLEHRILVV